MKPKLSTQDLRIAMGWVRDYCDDANAPKTPEEMKQLIEDIYEVEVDNLSDIQQFFNEQYDYEGYIEERVEHYEIN